MQTHPHQESQPNYEKERKTSLNLGKRNGVLSNDNNMNNNLNNVRTLTNKFDNRNSCSRVLSVTEIELKQVVNEQTKLISNLQNQLYAKDKRILDLETKVKMLDSKAVYIIHSIRPLLMLSIFYSLSFRNKTFCQILKKHFGTSFTSTVFNVVFRHMCIQLFVTLV